MYGSNCCLFWEPYKTNKLSVGVVQTFLMLNLVVHRVTIGFKGLNDSSIDIFFQWQDSPLGA
jgi:hypothetical protein